MKGVRPFDEIWETQKHQLKAQKIKLRWRTAVQKVKPNIPKRLTSVKEIWKYYLNRSSCHGLRYWLDKELHPFERIIWILTCFIGFGWATKIIYQIYSDFQLKKSNIIIDKINTNIDEIPFPSITVCPFSRVDWIKALAISETLIPKGNEKAKQHFLEILDRSSDFRLPSLRLDTNDSSVLQILNNINITKVMLDVLPECETFIFNCTWKFVTQTCCDIFELQRSYFGFCYSFNSLTSFKSKDKIPRFANNFGLHSGLRFTTILTNKSRLSPSMKAVDQQSSMPIMISDVHVIPLKSRYFAFGNRYLVSLKFTCSFASDNILALEMEANPPCKHEKGRYKYENCLRQCFGTYLLQKCKCLPSVFFYSHDVRSCNLSDMNCIAGITSRREFPSTKGCRCFSECEYVNYDDFTGIVPSKRKNELVIDIHFDGPTGVCYKRAMVTSTLDMLVQLGGIVGLFVGGSVISFAEFLYSILVTILCIIFCKFLCRKKKEKNRIRPVIEVNCRQ